MICEQPTSTKKKESAQKNWNLYKDFNYTVIFFFSMNEFINPVLHWYIQPNLDQQFFIK